MANKKHNLKAGVFISYIWVIVHIGVNFLYTPLLIKYLGQSEYGLYQVVASFLAYINVIETSVASGVLRYYCNLKAKGEEKKVENLLAICRRIYRLMSVGVVFLGIIVINFFRVFYSATFTTQEITEGSIMLTLLFFNLIITMTNAIYLASINGNERFVFVKSLSILSQIIQPIVCVLILHQYPFATVVVCVQVSLNVIVAFIRYAYAKKELQVTVKLHENDNILAKNVLLFASGILLSNIADQIFLKTDQIILAKFYNTSIVAVYSVGSHIYTNYMYAGITIANVFFPRVSRYYQEENGMKKISDLFIRVGRIAFFLCMLVLSGFVIWGKEFICLWVGEDYLKAYPIAIVVMVPFTVDVIQHLGLTILQVMNLYSYRAKMYFVAACFNIISTIILAYYWAGFGAALSTSASMFLTSGVMLNLFYSKKIGLDIKAFWKNIFGILLKLSPVIITGYLLNNMILYEYSWLHFVISIVIYSVVFCAVLYIIILDDNEKNVLKSIIRNKPRRN